MRFLEQAGEFLAGQVTFPIVNATLNRRGILRTYWQLVRSERYPEEAIRNLQLERLRDVIRYAVTWCPYYREKYRAAGIEPESIRAIEDVESIPILTREEVIEHHKEMVDSRYQPAIEAAEQAGRDPGVPIPLAAFRKHRIVRNTSTGSTGTPTLFYEDGTTSALNWAHELRVKRWFGLGPGAKEARVARVSADYVASSRAVMLRQRLWRQLVLPGMNLSDADYQLCIRKAEGFQPRILFGITSALAGLADYIERSRSAPSFHPDLIVTWAAPLYDHERALLERVFGCPVTNIYGSREVGHVAAMCPEGSMHINQEYYYVEVEEAQEPRLNSAAGDLLITTLGRRPMPFIRYHIGDIGEIGTVGCACGRSLQVLSNLVGRTGDVVTTRDGRMIAPNFWCRAFMGNAISHAVSRFQIVYQRVGSIRIRIEPRPDYSQDAEASLMSYIDRNLSGEYKIELEYVSKIDPQPSGKYQLIVNEWASAANGGTAN